MIGVITAMQEEADKIISALALPNIPHPIFDLYETDTIVLIISKVGKAQAALATTFLVQQYPLEKIINVGVVGRLNPHIAIGEVVVVKEVFQHDVFVPASIRPAYLYTSINCFVPEQLQQLQQVVLLTGDQFIEDAEKVATLQTQGDIVDMEGYSIALVAQTFHIPCIMIKAVSDGADNGATSIFLHNLDCVMDQIVVYIKEIMS